MIPNFFPHRLRFFLMVFSALFTVSSLAAQTLPPSPKKKYSVTVYVSSVSGSRGVGLYSLSVLGKATSTLHPEGSYTNVWGGYAPDPYLILTVQLEEGVATPVTIGADDAEFIRAWIPCADAYITIQSNLDSWTSRGVADLNLFESWFNNWNFSNNLPVSITVRSVKPKTAGDGPQMPPAS